MFALHTIDSFRRVSYQNMLAHVFTDRAYVKVQEFLHSMTDSLKSLDIRWLLPAFLAVTPGVEQYQTEIDPQNIAVLLKQDFFAEGKLASGESVLVFGEAGQIMGVEFFRSWFTSCGIEISVAEAEGFKAAERLFIAPTVLGNHFVRLEDAGNGRALVNHQLYTTEQLAFKLDELFARAFTLEVTPVNAGKDAVPVAGAKPAAAPASASAKESVPPPPPASVRPSVSSPPIPDKKFCSNCGSKLSAKAAFCRDCGKKV
jgi:hypothetical protein